LLGKKIAKRNGTQKVPVGGGKAKRIRLLLRQQDKSGSKSEAGTQERWKKTSR